jgi:hypothetical protein
MRKLDYVIYYDESNKLDQPEKNYSYYGAYGGEATIIEDITEKVKNIFKELNTYSELHFNKYTNDNKLVKYFKVLNHVINQDVTFNIFIVNNRDAENISRNMGIVMNDLRGLMYIKIPERLFYGITRHIVDHATVKIIVDQNDEYHNLELYTKLKEQMNAHSVYRNRKYIVDTVEPQESKNSIPLQIIDVFMGIVVFLIEKLYLEDSDVAIIKSDLIYRFLTTNENVLKFQKRIKLYKWEGNDKNISRVYISEYLSEFFSYKTQFDVREITRLQKLILENPDAKTKQLRELMGYSNSCLRMLLGYKDEIAGKGRNSYLLRQLEK